MSEHEAAMALWNRLESETRELLLSEFVYKSSPSVGAVSDAAPHPTVGDAPDRTATPSGGSGALSSLEQRVSSLEDDMRAVPALITESKRAHDLEHLIRLSTSSRRDKRSEEEAV